MQMNEKGETPIMTAIREQNFSAVRALLQCGCDLDAHLKVNNLGSMSPDFHSISVVDWKYDLNEFLMDMHFISCNVLVAHKILPKSGLIF